MFVHYNLNIEDCVHIVFYVLIQRTLSADVHRILRRVYAFFLKFRKNTQYAQDAPLKDPVHVLTQRTLLFLHPLTVIGSKFDPGDLLRDLHEYPGVKGYFSQLPCAFYKMYIFSRFPKKYVQ